MTKLEIIEETVKFYSEDTSRRALNEDGSRCEYLTLDGKKCAVGRCLDLDSEELLRLNGMGGVFNVYRKDLVFKKEYKGHSVDFWASLQLLHDSESNWTSKGLSGYGLKYLKELEDTYANK